MTGAPFDDVLAGEDGLRSVYRPPAAPSLAKEIDHLDDHCRAFVAHAPLLVLSTSAADGRCDVSPKGGPPGFVAVLDEHHLAVPDLSGNNRLDSFSNIVENPFVALLFLVPGFDETLRVNGRGFVTQDPNVLDACAVLDRRPRAALGVEVETAYLHCAKALRRSQLWSPANWPDTSDLPTPACMFSDHIADPGLTPEVLGPALERGYTRLWD